GTRFNDRDLGPFQVGRVGRFEPRDLAILVGDQRGPVEARLADAPAIAQSILEIVREARRINQEFLRHAAANDAGAADAILLRDHHARAIARSDAGSTDAARASTDHEQVDVRHSDRVLSFEPRSLFLAVASRRGTWQ